jgi:hypothetical protein
MSLLPFGDPLQKIKEKEFLNASWWYFVGPPPAYGGRRPWAKAAASPRRGLAAAQKETLISRVVLR